MAQTLRRRPASTIRKEPTMNNNRRRVLQLAGAALAAPFVARGAAATDSPWPSGPIRVLVGFTAGSTTDIVGRIPLERVAAQIGQPVVIENRGGAGGSIAAAAALQAEPNGHTLLVHSSGLSATPVILPNAPFDAATAFSGIAVFGSVPNILVVSSKSGIRTLADLIERSKKGNLTFASAGTGSASHWGAERLRIACGIEATHVPFRGGPEGLTEVMTGRVDFMSIGGASGLTLIRDGSLTPLVVSTRTRSLALPDVPTVIEAGYPGAVYTFWNGLLAPAKTPRAIVERMHGEVTKALAEKSVADKLAAMGNEPMALKPAEFDTMIRSDIEANLALAKAANIKFN
jgi:tripartite-type tricarboxylate transporter receptor subunit TctC